MLIPVMKKRTCSGTGHERVKTMMYLNKECVRTDGHNNDVGNPWFLVKGKEVNKKCHNTVM